MGKTNDRCPLQAECEQKCAHVGHELDCCRALLCSPEPFADAVTVLVEEAGTGGRAAAPIARQLFDIYLTR